MKKDEIIQSIEQIALKSNDDQVKLNALSYLLNRIEHIEKETELKAENEKFREKSKERFEGLLNTFM
jgi:thymidylate kinase